MTQAALKEAKDAHKSQLVNEVQGKARFKTLRANNELYMRVEAVQTTSEMQTDGAKTYNALLSKMRRGSDVPSKASIQTESFKNNQTQSKLKED